jgi:hypothetical protein
MEMKVKWNLDAGDGWGPAKNGRPLEMAPPGPDVLSRTKEKEKGNHHNLTTPTMGRETNRSKESSLPGVSWLERSG